MCSKINSHLLAIPNIKCANEDMSFIKEDKFLKTFSEIIDSVAGLVKHRDTEDDPGDISEWLKIVLLYNVPQGKQIRGRMVVDSFEELVDNPTEEMLKLARVLGWIVEILQASYLIADDIMDNGLSRRGRPCWYIVNNKGNVAFNDALLLEHLAYQLLRRYFSRTEMYTELLDQLLSFTFKTILGEGMDTRVHKTLNFEGYTETMYNSIVVYKTAYYTTFLPIALAMTLAGISERQLKNKELWEQVEDITLKTGKLFQIQDDYFDCFADEKTLGKVGRDIEEGKCTWLFVKAMELCGMDELQKLKANYGCTESERVAAVKTLYSSLGIPNKFNDYQEKIGQEIVNQITNVDNEKLRNILTATLVTIFRRTY